MRDYQRIYLTHANLKQRLHLIVGTIAGYHHSEKSAATHVYTIGGIFPATETPAEIDQLIEQAIARTPATSSAPHAGLQVQPEREG
jgi:hypothetical protein